MSKIKYCWYNFLYILTAAVCRWKMELLLRARVVFVSGCTWTVWVISFMCFLNPPWDGAEIKCSGNSCTGNVRSFDLHSRDVTSAVWTVLTWRWIKLKYVCLTLCWLTSHFSVNYSLLIMDMFMKLHFYSKLHWSRKSHAKAVPESIIYKYHWKPLENNIITLLGKRVYTHKEWDRYMKLIFILS